MVHDHNDEMYTISSSLNIILMCAPFMYMHYRLHLHNS